MENKIRALISQYKQDFLKYWDREMYKWQAVQWFQQHWNIDAADFGEMFDQATKRTANLLASANSFPKGIIEDFSLEFPLETKQMFVQLYDESIKLEQRIRIFKETASMLANKHNQKNPNNQWKNTYQNENSITTYLWLRYPDKYYIYKYSEFKDIAEALGYSDLIKHGKGYDNVKNGFEMYDKICAELLNDKEIIAMLSDVLQTDCYPDKALKTLTIDFGHYVYSYMKKHNYWAVGYTWENGGDQSERFYQEGIWIEGCLKDGDDKYETILKKVATGDYLLMKFSAIKGTGHKTSFTRLIKIGLVTKQINDYTFKVDWLNHSELPKDFENITYRETIEIMRQDAMLNYTKQLIEGNKPIIDMKKKNYTKYIKLLTANKNLILTGAPGTGKTFMAKAIAEEMGAEVGFVQFHPSYDYTDFVEGLRPFGDGGDVGFERKDGVFKEFCKSVLSTKNGVVSSFDLAYDSLCKDIKNETQLTVPLKSGKESTFLSISGKDTIKWEAPNSGNLSGNAISRERLRKLYQEYNTIEKLNKMDNISDSIRDIIKGCNTSMYYAVLHEVLKRIPMYDNSQSLSNHFTNTETKKDLINNKVSIFIIDEINRGEISKIFGELFFSIDPGYRGEKGKVKTQYQNLIEDDDIFKDGFYVPENVYIIGTMNDIDRSVESMDFAMRRRFAWQEVTAEESYLNMIDNDAKFADVKDEIKGRMFNLNKAIAETEGLNESYQIGAAYFRKYFDYMDAENPFDCLWKNHLKGLLFEYLRGNHKAQDLLEKLHNAYNKISIDEQPTHTDEG